MVVIDGPIMSAEIFRALAGMLSIPVDFDALRLRISEIISNVLISVNSNIDSRVGHNLLVDSSSGESSISEASFVRILTKKLLKDSAIDCSSEMIASPIMRLSLLETYGIRLSLFSQKAVY